VYVMGGTKEKKFPCNSTEKKMNGAGGAENQPGQGDKLGFVRGGKTKQLIPKVPW